MGGRKGVLLEEGLLPRKSLGFPFHLLCQRKPPVPLRSTFFGVLDHSMAVLGGSVEGRVVFTNFGEKDRESLGVPWASSVVRKDYEFQNRKSCYGTRIGDMWGSKDR